jgi:uncharacterized membrane protein
VKHTFRNSFVTGLVLIAPLVITIVALRIVFGWILGFIDPIVQATQLTRYTANIEIVAQLLTLGMILLFIMLLGFSIQRGVGVRALGGVDRAIGLVPLVRVIYSSVQQVADSLLSSGSRFESVVLVEFPREGIYAIGFVTDESPKPVQTEIGTAYNVYMPNSPNPTNGWLTMVPEEQVYEIDMSPRRGIHLLVTTGMGQSGDEEEIEEQIGVDLDQLR